MAACMLELGNQSAEEHQSIINLLEDKGFENVLLVGCEFKNTKHSFRVFEKAENLSALLKEQCPENYTILIKGSRGIQLEKIISLL